jgi:putative oxidoreductase
MITFGVTRFSDSALLIARVFLVVRFLLSGWEKLTDFGAAVAEMVTTGAPVPIVSAVVAIIIEIFVALALLAGVLTRPLAILLALYTLATAVIGRHYWTFTGQTRADNLIEFYKNISIAGGLLALYASGAGRYSVDANLDPRLRF